MSWSRAQRNLFNSTISISRSFASSGASVSLVMASAFGAALSASAGLQPASFLSSDGIGVYGHDKRTQPAALARAINEPG
jgi:glutamate-1-semialdehyde aminotransferase